MYTELLLAIIQGLTEFLPISSSGHLALFGNIIGSVDVSYFTLLHLASVVAIVIYTRREIASLCSFDKRSQKRVGLLVLGILPAAVVGFLFNEVIEQAFTSLFVIGISFIVTGILVFSTKFVYPSKGKITTKRSLAIGIAQIAALFPGISRSGTTISVGLFSGLEKKEAFRFSFLMAIPLILGATILEFSITALTTPMILGFIVCIVISLLGLFIVEKTLLNNYFWMFGVYAFLVGVLTVLFLY